MRDLHLATIVTADARRFRATVRLTRDGRLLDRVPVNGGIRGESLVTGQPCLVAVLGEGREQTAVVVSTSLD